MINIEPVKETTGFNARLDEETTQLLAKVVENEISNEREIYAEAAAQEDFDQENGEYERRNDKLQGFLKKIKSASGDIYFDTIDYMDVQSIVNCAAEEPDLYNAREIELLKALGASMNSAWK